MIHFVRIYAIFLLVAMASSARSQELAGDLPRVGELLQRAREQIALLDKEYERSHRYHRIAVLYGRSGDVREAFNAIERTSVPLRPYPGTIEMAKRERYLNMVEAVASQGAGRAAIELVEEAPKAYRRYSDDAYGRIAVAVARDGDTDGALKAISLIKPGQGGYPYELLVAKTLGDQARARRLSLVDHRRKLDALVGRSNLAREEWAGLVGTLSLYRWCGIEKEFEELAQQACATSDDPAKARAEVMSHLEAESVEGLTDSKEAVKEMPLAVEDIRSLLAAANRAEHPRERADLLLNAAGEILRLNRSATVPASD